MIIITGGAGFIGSNLVHHLNRLGYYDIVVVDDMTEGAKFRNLAKAQICDFVDKDELLEKIQSNQEEFGYIQAIFHLGACSDTTEWNGRFMMYNNFTYSKLLLHFAIERRIPFIYASSAAVYGNRQQFQENLASEEPINVYAYSKWLFDQYVRQVMPKANSQIVGLRYFNVYGPREAHKGKMASVAYQFNQQLINSGSIKLFGAYAGYEAGEQRRDFVCVNDVVKVHEWFMKHSEFSGIYNVGTGRAQTFNEVAQAVIDWHGHGVVNYIDIPEHLKGSYQSYTQADITQLRQTGFDAAFASVQEGVSQYLDWLNQSNGS